LPVQSPNFTDSSSCFLFPSSYTILMSFSVTDVAVLLPFCLGVWFLGLQRRCWQKQNSHLDVFTYHMVTMEMVGVVACAVYLYGFVQTQILMIFTALEVYANTTYGQVYFHILTCLDRYVAVVHPIVYMRLKERGGTRLRNSLIGCVWFLFIVKFFHDFEYVIQLFCLGFSIAVVMFCNFAVLYVLLRPPPGERVHISQSKMRAFKTIVLILCALLFRMIPHLSVLGFFDSNLLSPQTRCVVLVSGVFFGLPSSAV
ncbi:hypothetical protein NL108_018082, partial [Boleophthalmus pectinirostris]